MPIRITRRSQVFETNSSSTHSITIAHGRMLKSGFSADIVPDAEGNIILEGGEFGWQWEKTNSSLTKANYCAVAATSREDTETDNRRMLAEVLLENVPNAKSVIYKFTTLWFDDSESSSPIKRAYIDHESEGVANAAFQSKETLEQFIFNPLSVLCLGNDNESPPANFTDINPTQFKYVLYLKDVPKQKIYIDKKSEIDNIEHIYNLVTSLYDDNHELRYVDRETEYYPEDNYVPLDLYWLDDTDWAKEKNHTGIKTVNELIDLKKQEFKVFKFDPKSGVKKIEDTKTIGFVIKKNPLI
jgi:hypothetical protein